MLPQVTHFQMKVVFWDYFLAIVRQSDLLWSFRGDCGEATENLIFPLVLKQKAPLTTLLFGLELRLVLKDKLDDIRRHWPLLRSVAKKQKGQDRKRLKHSQDKQKHRLSEQYQDKERGQLHSVMYRLPLAKLES